ncbi:MAG: hypothetical protein Kow0065_23850 [Methylomicrobium sp.]
MLSLLPIALSSSVQNVLFIAAYHSSLKRGAQTVELDEPNRAHYLDGLAATSSLINLAALLATGLLLRPIFRRLDTIDRTGLDSSIADTPTTFDDRPDKFSLLPTVDTAWAQSTGENTDVSEDFSILIADDNQINRLLLINQLCDHCEHIDAAQDGIEAYKLLRKKRYDIVFLDLQMPGYTGFELIDMTRKTPNPNRETPIIAVTAHALPHQRHEIVTQGFDECLIKPVLAEQLEEILSLWRPSRINAAEPTSYVRQILIKTDFDRDLALIILNKLIEELPRQMSTIKKSVTQCDWKAATLTAHQLHGSVSFCGLTDMRELAGALENSLKIENPQQTQNHFDKLHNLIQKFVAKKEDLIAHLQEK